MKTIKFLLTPFIAAALLAALTFAIGIGPRPAQAQSGGTYYVAVMPIPTNATNMVFTIVGTGATYRPLTNAWARLYSDGTFQVVCYKVTGSGPAYAEVRAHFTDLDSTTMP